MSPEEENTFRTLKEELLLRTSFWCRFGIHKWTKWSKPTSGKSGRWWYQICECAACGQYKFKDVKHEL